MPFETPITIAESLRKIATRQYVLPAIQREFVWSRGKIARLFDSLMRGYPIGSFLMWQVEPQNIDKFVFYDFLRDYHARDHAHCEPTGPLGREQLTAVLDGQQRLTALNIGLSGSHTMKLPRAHAATVTAYPPKHLYLDLVHEGDDDDLGLVYDFRFLSASEVASAELKPGAAWFLVRDIMAIHGVGGVIQALQQRGLGNDGRATKVLPRLHEVVHVLPTVSFFLESAQELDKVLNIFIRVNSGGVELSYSDLLLSVATAQWTGRDARETIHGLVDDLNRVGQGFSFSKDLVLKTGLVLLGSGDIRFHVDNFDRRTMAELDKRWESIDNSLRQGTRLLADFGYSAVSLTANSVLIPVAYYLSRRDVPSNYLTADLYRTDRDAIRRWTQRALIKTGVWGSGLDRLLTGLRTVIDKEGAKGWPTDAIEAEMARQGKSLRFEMTEVDDLLSARYGAKRVFPLLALLYGAVDTRGQFHIDHVFPRSLLTSRVRLRTEQVPDGEHGEYALLADQLPNLQLLRGPDNIAKQDRLPGVWLASYFPTEEQRESWLREYDSVGLPGEVLGFPEFFASRRSRMRTRLAQLLGVSVPVESVETVSGGEPNVVIPATDEPDPGNEGL